jgi:hypothetical protein
MILNHRIAVHVRDSVSPAPRRKMPPLITPQPAGVSTSNGILSLFSNKMDAYDESSRDI